MLENLKKSTKLLIIVINKHYRSLTLNRDSYQIAILIAHHIQYLTLVVQNTQTIADGSKHTLGAIAYLLRLCSIEQLWSLDVMSPVTVILVISAFLFLQLTLLGRLFFLVASRSTPPIWLAHSVSFCFCVINRYLLFVPLLQVAFYIQIQHYHPVIADFSKILIIGFTITKLLSRVITFEPDYSTLHLSSEREWSEYLEIITVPVVLVISMYSSSSSLTAMYILLAFSLFQVICRCAIINTQVPKHYAKQIGAWIPTVSGAFYMQHTIESVMAS